jgi:hypothetical protein
MVNGSRIGSLPTSSASPSRARVAGHRGRAGRATIKALEDHVATLKGEVERLKTLASEESAKTAQAIAAFESLAQRLEELAQARRPLWHRLLWRA